MNIKHTIAATTIIATALAAGAFIPAAVGAFAPGPATLLAPANADPFPIAPPPIQPMSAETAEFDEQVYTANDSPQVVGLDPGIYYVPVWGADRDTSILYV